MATVGTPVEVSALHGVYCVEYLYAEMLRDILKFAKYELIISRNTPCSTEDSVLCCVSVTMLDHFEFL